MLLSLMMTPLCGLLYQPAVALFLAKLYRWYTSSIVRRQRSCPTISSTNVSHCYSSIIAKKSRSLQYRIWIDDGGGVCRLDRRWPLSTPVPPGTAVQLLTVRKLKLMETVRGRGRSATPCSPTRVELLGECRRFSGGKGWRRH